MISFGVHCRVQMFPSMKEPSGLLQTDGKWPDGATLDLLTLDQLFDLYSTATTSLLDSMLPRHPVKSRIGLKSVWFDAECWQVRRRVRCAERRFRRTKDHDDRLMDRASSLSPSAIPP